MIKELEQLLNKLGYASISKLSGDVIVFTRKDKVHLKGIEKIQNSITYSYITNVLWFGRNVKDEKVTSYLRAFANKHGLHFRNRPKRNDYDVD